MKVESIVINILVAAVALLAGHVFWPASSVVSRSTNEPALASNAAVPAVPSAPTGNSPTPPSPFTPDLKERLAKAREAALAADPTLKSEEDSLLKMRDFLMKQTPPASTEERAALLQKWKDHSEKLKDDMIKADPSLQPFFAELDARVKAQQAQAATASASGTLPTARIITSSPTTSTRTNDQSATKPNAGH
jgi:hypothetical protein